MISFHLGHGKCLCNKCQCDTDTNGDLFSGVHCELYPSESKPCKLLAPKVECQVFGNLDECEEVNFDLEEIDENDPSLVKHYPPCEAVNENGCTFR